MRVRPAVVMALLLCCCGTVRETRRVYTVRVATHWQLQAALLLEQDLLAAGYAASIDVTTISPVSAKKMAGFVMLDAGRTFPTPTRYRVDVGPFQSEDDAKHTLEQLRAAGFDAYLMKRCW